MSRACRGGTRQLRDHPCWRVDAHHDRLKIRAGRVHRQRNRRTDAAPQRGVLTTPYDEQPATISGAGARIFRRRYRSKLRQAGFTAATGRRAGAELDAEDGTRRRATPPASQRLRAGLAPFWWCCWRYGHQSRARCTGRDASWSAPINRLYASIGVRRSTLEPAAYEHSPAGCGSRSR